jgi:Tol biopolymer transport system component
LLLEHRLLVNDVATIPGVTAEPHAVTIGDVVDNCTVSGDTTQAVNVLAQGTTTVSFSIGCVLAERIAYSSFGTIAVRRVDGVSSVPVTHGFAPAWSADGARLAYECGADLCAINPDGSGLAQLTTTGASNHHPAWSPDGSKIAFSAATNGVPDLWVMAANGSGAVQLTQNAGFVGSPAWSPDGTKIAFDCQVDAANDDICVVNADGTGLARLTSDPARDYGAAWKRDGSTLAFATTRYGPDEIVLMSSTGGAVTRIGAGLLGSEPTWSPDGGQLGFVRVDQFDQANIMVAHTDGTNVVKITNGDQPAWRPHP